VPPPTTNAFSLAPTRPDTWEGLANWEAVILRSYAVPLLSLSRWASLDVLYELQWIKGGILWWVFINGVHTARRIICSFVAEFVLHEHVASHLLIVTTSPQSLHRLCLRKTHICYLLDLHLQLLLRQFGILRLLHLPVRKELRCYEAALENKGVLSEIDDALSAYRVTLKRRSMSRPSKNSTELF
jgi:hypothetical protein